MAQIPTDSIENCAVWRSAHRPALPYPAPVAIERPERQQPQRRISIPAVIVIGGLAVFGAVTLVQWLLTSIIGIVKLIVAVVVLLGIAGWVVSAKANR